MINDDYRHSETDDSIKEIVDEYEEILEDLDAIERDLTLFVLAGAVGSLWYLWYE